jgi:hypothetical protein
LDPGLLAYACWRSRQLSNLQDGLAVNKIVRSSLFNRLENQNSHYQIRNALSHRIQTGMPEVKAVVHVSYISTSYTEPTTYANTIFLAELHQSMSALLLRQSESEIY